jgi:hypothetical protein
LNTLLAGELVTSVSGWPGPFQVPSAQKTMFFMMPPLAAVQRSLDRFSIYSARDLRQS